MSFYTTCVIIANDNHSQYTVIAIHYQSKKERIEEYEKLNINGSNFNICIYF